MMSCSKLLNAWFASACLLLDWRGPDGCPCQLWTSGRSGRTTCSVREAPDPSAYAKGRRPGVCTLPCHSASAIRAVHTRKAVGPQLGPKNWRRNGWEGSTAEGKVWDIFAIQRCCYERPAMPVAAIQRITRLRAP